jgi:DNA repair protein RecO (recombination protein O)
MSSCRTRGIILQVAGHGESDKIITFYSPTIGRVSSIAKGAQRSKHRFVNKLEPFTLLEIMYRPPRTGGLFFLSEAALENPFLRLRTDHRRYLTAMLACELVLRFTTEQDPDPEIFSLLHWLLDTVNRGSAPLQSVALFHLRLLGAAGYQPELERCCRCGEKVDNRRSFALQPANGSLVCNRCNTHVQRSKFSLSLQTIRFLQSAQQLDISRLERLQMPEKAAHESMQVLYRYSRHLLQRDIHSWHFVATMIN